MKGKNAVFLTLLILILILNSFSVSSQSGQSVISLQNDLNELNNFFNEIDHSEYRTIVEDLANDIGPRPFESDGNIKTINYIKNYITDVRFDYPSVFINYEEIGSYRNIVAHLKSPMDPELKNNSAMIFIAHFDSVSNAPGADDNGSGTAYVLYLLSLINKLIEAGFYFPFDFYFVFANAEEIGLLGSTQVASWFNSKDTNILIVQNSDMLLYGAPVVHFDENQISQQFAFRVANNSLKYDDGAVIAEPANSAWTRSDHYSFAKLGISSVVAFESDILINPYYHSSEDVPSASGYNYNHPVDLAQSVLLTIAELSNIHLSDFIFDVLYDPIDLVDYNGKDFSWIEYDNERESSTQTSIISTTVQETSTSDTNSTSSVVSGFHGITIIFIFVIYFALVRKRRF